MLEVTTSPWGGWEDIAREDGYRVKRITVNQGCRLSLQKHRFRSEHWIVIGGSGFATKGERRVPLQQGAHLFIEIGEIHRLEASPNERLVLIEVQLGTCEEGDIERLEDDFGRV